MKTRESIHRKKTGRAIAAVVLALSVLVPASIATTAVADVDAGDTAWIGPRQGYSGTGVFPVYSQTPADPSDPGEPDFWAYCIEHDVSAETELEGVTGDRSGFLGGNKFTDPAVQARVQWTVSHSYPAVSLTALATAAGITGLSRNDAIEATQYAIWNFTDLWSDPDAAWNWETPNSEAVYHYLVNGALAGAGTTPPAVQAVSVAVSGPTSGVTAGILAGPFRVTTNQPTARVASDPAYPFTDAAGVAIDADAVIDGQELYLDLRNVSAAGSATITATVSGTGATGLILSVPKVAGGTATAESHAQSLILVGAAGATTSASAAIGWLATDGLPAIGTTLFDAADDDQVLPWRGGTLIDSIAYTGLTPGTQYTVSGVLMRKTGASATAITGSTTFTPVTADGSVDVTFVVPTGYAGQSLVAFERLFLGATATGTPIAVHTDIDDANQTIAVSAAPSIGTRATTDNAADDKVLPLTGGTITDTVAYAGFEANDCTPEGCATDYEISGELMLVTGGTATTTGIVSAPKTFTTSAPSGTIAVTFELTAAQVAQYAGKTLVVFETVREWTRTTQVPVSARYAEHRDPTDADQSVTVAARPAVVGASPHGGDLATTGAMAPIGLASAAALALLAGATLLIARRRKASGAV